MNETVIKQGLIISGSTVASGSLTVNTDTLFVDATNNRIGIGTTVPNSIFHISETAPILTATSTNNSSGLRFNIFGSALTAYRFQYGGSTLLQINPDGRVGIGTITPSAKLQVNTTTENDGISLIGSSTNTRLTIANSAAPTGEKIISITNNSSVTGLIFQKLNDDYTFNSNLVIIKPSGNVGIGTTNPASYAKLSVNGNVKIGNGASANVLYGGFEGAILNQTAYQGYNIVYSGGDFQSVKLGGTNDPTNYYYNTTHVFGNRSNVELMRITSAGNVGIGTASPAQKLDVAGGDIILSSNATYIRSKDASGNTPRMFGINPSNNTYIGPIDPYAGGAVFYGVSANVSSQTFYTGASARLHINSAGNVGIGTTSPVAKLTVNQLPVAELGSTSYGSAVIHGANYNLSSTQRGIVDINYIDVAAQDNGSTLTFTNNVGMFGNGYSYVGVGLKAGKENSTNQNQRTYFAISTNNNSGVFERMRITSDGNVGIGTTSPSNRLVVDSGATNVSAVFQSSDTGVWINLRDGDSGTDINNYGVLIGHQLSTGELFKVADSSVITRFLVTTSGNVGIGTTSPSEKLHVDGNLLVSGIITAQEFHTEFVSASIIYESGSTKFGDSSDDVHSFTGSIQQAAGSDSYFLGDVGIGTTVPGYTLSVEKSIDSGLLSRFYNTSTTNGQGLLIRAGETNAANRVLQVASRDDTKIMTVNSNGSVGIGTTTPAYKLEVAGDVGINGYIYHNGDDSRIGFEGNDAIRMYTANSVRLQINSNGNVGIGTTTPGYLLDVAGNAAITGGNRLWFKGGSDIGLENAASDNAIYIANTGAAGSSVLDIGTGTVVIQEGGNVGIGTTSPGYKLDVNNTTNENLARFYRDSNSATSISHLVSTGRPQTRYTYDGYTSWYLGNNLGTFGIGPGYLASTAATLNITAAGNVGIGTTSPEARLHIAGGHLLLNNGIELRSKDTGGSVRTIARVNGSTNDLEYGWSGAGAVKFMGGGAYTERMRIHTDGNVGIGTTSPIGKLQIGGTSGNLLTVGTLTNNWAGEVAIGVTNGNGVIISKINASNDTNRVLVFYRDDTNGATIWGYKPSGGGTDTGFQFRANGTSYFNGGNVGIGTTSPDRQLQVHESTSGTSTAKFTNSTTGEDGDTGFFVGINGSEQPILFGYNSTDMVIGTNGTEKMRITSDGNVGIGTTSPSDKLSVNGSIGVNYGGYLGFYRYPGAGHTFGADGVTSAMFGVSSGVFTGRVNAGLVVSGYDQIRHYTSNVERMRIDTSGNVGIGTTSPDAPLTVTNNAVSSYIINVNMADDVDGGGFYEAAGGMELYLKDTSGTGQVKLTSSGLSYLNGGNVGIGTSSPAYKLDVSGTGRFTDILYANGVEYTGGTIGQAKTVLFTNNVLYTRGGSAGHFLQNADGSEGMFLANDHIRLETNSTERIRIVSSGNVGIGTTTPSAQLDITKTFNARAGAQSNPTGGASVAIDYQTSSDIQGRLRSRDWDGAAWKNFTIEANNILLSPVGNVGIGTTSPSAKLDVYGGTSRFWHNGTTYYTQFDNNNEINTYASNGTISTMYLNYRTGGDVNIARGAIVAKNAGNVGIGTTSPTSKLHVAGDLFITGSDTSATTKNFHVQTGNGTSIMDFRNETYAFFGCGQGGGNASGFIFRYRSPSYTQFCGYTYGNGSSPSYQPIYMDTDQVGRSQGIYINYTTGSAPASTEFAVKGRGTTSSTFTAKFQDSNTADVFIIQDNGDVKASGDITAFYSSDENLKANIQPITNPIEKINQIGGYEFDWKPESSHTGHDVGVIAQEIETVLPEVVTTRTNGYKAVRYEKIVPLLIEAIKEQQKQIDELKALLK